jgi:sugar O-acyltransferase (sialic acid O-acetyltransferase NeuD family)
MMRMNDVEKDQGIAQGHVGQSRSSAVTTQQGQRNPVAIFGAGGFGLDIGIDLMSYGDKVVFLDDDFSVKPKVDAIGSLLVGGKEKLEDPKFLRRHDLIIALGNNRLRRKFAAIACSNGAKLSTFIHPEASVGLRLTLGEGVIVMRGAMVSNRATIGKGSVILNGATVPHDCVIGDFVNICDGSTLGACRIGDDTFVGMGVSINTGITIGRNVLVGLGAVVVHNIPDNVVIYGVPARIAKERAPVEHNDSYSSAALPEARGPAIVPIFTVPGRGDSHQ